MRLSLYIVKLTIRHFAFRHIKTKLVLLQELRCPYVRREKMSRCEHITHLTEVIDEAFKSIFYMHQ